MSHIAKYVIINREWSPYCSNKVTRYYYKLPVYPTIIRIVSQHNGDTITVAYTILYTDVVVGRLRVKLFSSRAVTG